MMPASTSSVSVAGQPSISLVIPHDVTKRSSNIWLPLSPFASYSWDVQEDLEDVQRSDEYATSSSPPTPGLSWDSHCGSSDIFDSLPKSVFEDWDDPPFPNVLLEDDGAQTLLITSESPFYHPPPTPPSFHFAPFSTGAFLDLPLSKSDSIDESEPIVDIPAPLKRPEGIRSTKAQMLFLDTMFSSLGNDNNNTFALSANFIYSPVDEVPLWAPRAFMYGPDVPLDPLDCIYSAGDISPIERWDEKLWPTALLRPLRTAPCS